MLPLAFLDRIRVQLGPEYPAFLAAYDRPRAVGLRLNSLKTDRFPNLPFSTAPIPWAEHGFWYDPQARPGLHPWHEAGLYYLQEPSAMAPVSARAAMFFFFIQFLRLSHVERLISRFKCGTGIF